MFFGYQTSTGDLGAGPGSQECLWFRGSAGACSTLGLRLPFPISALCLADNTCWKKSGTAQYICHLSRSLSQPFCSGNGCSSFLGGFRDKGSCGVCSWREDVQLLKDVQTCSEELTISFKSQDWIDRKLTILFVKIPESPVFVVGSFVSLCL